MYRGTPTGSISEQIYVQRHTYRSREGEGQGGTGTGRDRDREGEGTERERDKAGEVESRRGREGVLAGGSESRDLG